MFNIKRILKKSAGWFVKGYLQKKYQRGRHYTIKDDLELRIIHAFYSKYHPINIIDPGVKDSKRNVTDRLRVITEHLKGKNCLDIGCGSGYFVFNIAQKGFWVTGVDADRIILRKGRLIQKKYDVKNAELMHFIIDEESVKKLPEYDNIVYLSIHHHMIKVHGYEKATDIFKTIATKVKYRMFFDFPYYEDVKDLPVFSGIPSMGEDQDAWIEGYLHNVGFQKISRLGVFTHPEKLEEKRQLFMAEH